jgi:pimeloyl-ACP methyl ester carboxylesterase
MSQLITQGCPYVEKGNKYGPVILFMAGFPDDETSGWGTLIPEELGKTHRLIFMCLPGYGNPKLYASQEKRRWGYTEDEVILMMHATIEMLKLTDRPFVFTAHDWGAYYALHYTTKYPQSASKLILCDIGMVSVLTIPLATLPFLLFYQSYFAVSFAISQILGNTVGQCFYRMFGFLYHAVCPSRDDRKHVPFCRLTVYKCYPYYYLWRSLLTLSMKKAAFPTCPLLFMVRYGVVLTILSAEHLSSNYSPFCIVPFWIFLYFPSVLLLFLPLYLSLFLFFSLSCQHGTQKRCDFHDSAFLRRIDATPGCRREQLPSGHWFMLGDPQRTLAHIQQFLTIDPSRSSTGADAKAD